MNQPILELHKKYIKGTERKAMVPDITVFLCYLTNAVKNALQVSTIATYINTKVLKHLYDKRPAQEYEFLVENIHRIIKYPDSIYKNREGKRGSFCFTKKLKNEKYFCSLEETSLLETKDKTGILVVTAFRIEEKYIEKYELLWSWRDDKSSS